MATRMICPECRMRQLEQAYAWIDAQLMGAMDPALNPRINPDAGQEFLRRTALGVPQNVGQVMKPVRFAMEEMGFETPQQTKKRKLSASAKKRQKLMSKNLKIANKRGRKKNGEYKKGWGQSRIMSTAHRMTRKEMNQ